MTQEKAPLAWAFEYRPKVDGADWHKTVQFSDPRESFCTIKTMEIKNLQPLYAASDKTENE